MKFVFFHSFTLLRSSRLLSSHSKEQKALFLAFSLLLPLPRLSYGLVLCEKSALNSREGKPKRQKNTTATHQRYEAPRAPCRGDRALGALVARVGVHPLVRQRLLLLCRGRVHLPRWARGALRLDQGGTMVAERKRKRAREREVELKMRVDVVVASGIRKGRHPKKKLVARVVNLFGPLFLDPVPHAREEKSEAVCENRSKARTFRRQEPYERRFEHARLTRFFSSLSLHGRKRERERRSNAISSSDSSLFAPRFRPPTRWKRKNASQRVDTFEKKKKRRRSEAVARHPSCRYSPTDFFFEIGRRRRRRRSHLSRPCSTSSSLTKNPENETKK